jgi:hypothetical protein
MIRQTDPLISALIQIRARFDWKTAKRRWLLARFCATKKSSLAD